MIYYYKQAERGSAFPASPDISKLSSVQKGEKSVADKRNRKQKKKKSRAASVVKWVGLTLGTLLLVGAMTFAILCCYAASYLQDVIIPEVKSSSVNLVTSGTDLSSVIYYQDGDSCKTLQTLYASENRVWAAYEDIPEDLIHATVAIEDKRFYQHHGVDWKRTAAAAFYMFTGQSIQGGSTITQQLIKNLTQQDQVTVRRKVLEIFEALEFDRTHTKEEIMEWYLNEIYLGRGCYGVKTAAQKYFGKELDELDLAECASLISITNNPSLYDPYSHPENNLKRRKLVLEEMCSQGYIDEETRDAAQQEELTFTSGTSSGETGASGESYYSWYTDAVIAQVIEDLEEKYDYDSKTAAQMVYSGGLQIYSCLNEDVQEQVDAVYSDLSNVSGMESADGDQLQSAITVVDNETGAIVALAGGVGEKVGNRIWNRATDTLRQPGSSMKPLAAYSQALENGDILPNTILEDSAFMKVNGRDWPKNSHGGYSGKVDVLTAVAESLNTIAVKTLDLVGTEESYSFLKDQFHLSSLVDDYTSTTGKNYSDIGYSQLALGGLTKGVSTDEMAGAYSTFARGGVFIAPHLYTVVLSSEGEVLLAADGYDAQVDSTGRVTVTGSAAGETILSQSTCFYMTEMMEAVVTQGTGTAAAIDGMSVAGKTGTTDDDYDRWFVGYTPYYTAAVWSGYDTSSRIQSANNPSTVLWQKVMSRVSSGQENEGFGEDMDAVEVTYCTKCGGIATSDSKSTQTAGFLQGDEPAYQCTCRRKTVKKEEKKETEQTEEKQAEETPAADENAEDGQTQEETPAADDNTEENQEKQETDIPAEEDTPEQEDENAN